MIPGPLCGSRRDCCLLVKISIADLIGGTRGVSRGPPTPASAWAPLDVKKCTDIYCEKYAKIWKLLKMYTWNIPFQISKYATGWEGGAATQTFAPGGKYPRAATASDNSAHNISTSYSYLTVAPSQSVPLLTALVPVRGVDFRQNIWPRIASVRHSRFLWKTCVKFV